MSKVIVQRAFAKDSFYVEQASIDTGWMPGMAFKLNTTGDKAVLGTVDAVVFIGIDDDDELASPPSGSLVTGIYGAGTKFVIDHSEEVEAGSSDRAYDSSVESAAINALLYIDSASKFTATESGTAKGIMIQKPAATNNYGLGVISRF